MSENLTPDVTGGDAVEPAPVAPPPPKRGPGHRGQDIRDTMAEMAAKAHEISLEAGSKMASTMRDVIGAAAGISAFAIESARDLVNYMVRRGQMSQEEATRLLREVEEAHAKLPKADLPKKIDVPAKVEVKVVREVAKAAERVAAAPIAEKPAPAEKPAKAPEKQAVKAKAREKPASKASPSKAKPASKAPARTVAAKKAAARKK